ncbi:hypothetical protein T06_3107 [Trichinella sp. T6]|nr:hypothetical protein T06_3107 [Trichinella sp. T6]
MGGYWARFVRTTKESLRNVLGQALLGDEQLRTVLCVVDACLNARPLTLVEEATDKLVPLSPFQLLTGRISQSELALPRAQARQLNSRWRYRQQLIAKWWRRWRNGYSPLGYRAGIGQTAATAWPERHGSRPQLLRSPGPLAICLLEAGTTGNLSALFQYFRQEWMIDERLPLGNVYDVNIRTNNHLEGWHNRLNRKAGKSHNELYELLQLLISEQGVMDTLIQQVLSGNATVGDLRRVIKVYAQKQR